MKKLLVVLLLLMVFIGACSKDEQKTDVKQPEAGKDKELYTFPFSGLQTSDEGEVKNRAVAVMVNNHPDARPQTGLSEADIVFEMLAEGNITRFLAIYQSSFPDMVGPVRSAREYYFSLADRYDALYVYHGAAKFIDEMIRDRDIEHLNGAKYDNDGILFLREDFRVAPHNSYLLFDAVYDVAETKDYVSEYDYEALPFSDENAEVDGEVANYAKIEYYGNTPYVEFEYDPTTKKYTRYNDGERSIELVSEKPLQIDNVFIVEADHEVIDADARRAIDIDSGGKAYLLQRGKVQYLEWENRDGRIVPVKDGELVPFVPGQTWINFVQTEPPANVTEQVQILENKE